MNGVEKRTQKGPLDVGKKPWPYKAPSRLANTVGALVCLAPASTRCLRACHATWGGSPVGGHSDVFSGGSMWTVTSPLFSLHCSLLVLICALIVLMTTLPQTPIPANRVGGHASSPGLQVVLALHRLASHFYKLWGETHQWSCIARDISEAEALVLSDGVAAVVSTVFWYGACGVGGADSRCSGPD